ncbi:MAG TPA: hypothetical protein VN914_02645 [Polyangia bacterium]|nr:hypothetical protein [Polyangia bacterium]
MRRALVPLLGLSVLLACGPEAPPPVQKQPAPPPVPVDARPPADGGGADARLGMMERHALWKAKKEADAKLAAELAAQEQARLIKFDRARLPQHLAFVAFVKKARAQLDAAAAKAKGKPAGRAQIEKVVAAQRKGIEAQGKALAKLDPKGGNSNITTDHDMSLQLLANDYPAALVGALGGDEKPLADARAELDKRQQKIASWLVEVKKAKR